jgi:hypothetical protein
LIKLTTIRTTAFKVKPASNAAFLGKMSGKKFGVAIPTQLDGAGQLDMLSAKP